MLPYLSGEVGCFIFCCAKTSRVAKTWQKFIASLQQGNSDAPWRHPIYWVGKNWLTLCYTEYNTCERMRGWPRPDCYCRKNLSSMVMVALFVRDSSAFPHHMAGFMCTARRTMENFHITAAHGKIHLGSSLYAPLLSLSKKTTKRSTRSRLPIPTGPKLARWLYCFMALASC